MGKADDLVTILWEQNDSEANRKEFVRQPMPNKRDQDLIASLKQILDPIKKMRNCVTHNRTASETSFQDYHAAKPMLEATLTVSCDRFGPSVPSTTATAKLRPKRKRVQRKGKP